MAGRFDREPAREPAPSPVLPHGRPTTTAGDAGVARLLTLQRLAGNAAVARLVTGTGGTLTRSPTTLGALVLQRAPAFGLGAPQATNAFARTAVKWWQKYPGTTLDNFNVIMVEEASSSLEKIGVPPVELDNQTSTGPAVFHADTWTISVNAKAAGFTPDTKIGDLKPDELADLANTFFHEARHAEQRFLMARLAVGKSPGKDAKAIAAEVKTKESVAAAAIKAGGGLSRAEKAKAEQLTEFFDKHIGYKIWISRLQALGRELLALVPDPSPSGVDPITTASKALAPKIDELRKEAPVADTRVDSLSKRANRTAVDEQVLTDLRKMRDVIKAAIDKATVLAQVVADWQKTKASQAITVDATKRAELDFNWRWLELEGAARDVFLGAEDAYEHYPEEADSRVVGAAVAAAVLPQAKAVRRPSKAP